MSKESHLSINMPYTALTGEHFGPTGARFSFGLPYEQSMPEPQSKPQAQPVQPDFQDMREQELVEVLQQMYGKDWKAYYPITEPQPTAQQNEINRGVIFDSPKVTPSTPETVNESTQPSQTPLRTADHVRYASGAIPAGEFTQEEVHLDLNDRISQIGRMQPHNNFIGVGVGAALAGAGVVAYLNKERINRRFPQIREVCNREYYRVRNFLLEFGLDYAPNATVRYICADVENRNSAYAQIGQRFDDADRLALLAMRKGEHGVQMIHMVYRIIASLAEVNATVRPAQLAERLNEELDHFLVDRSQRWELEQDEYGLFNLIVAGKKYSLRTFAGEIRKKIQQDELARGAAIAKIDPEVV